MRGSGRGILGEAAEAEDAEDQAGFNKFLRRIAWSATSVVSGDTEERIAPRRTRRKSSNFSKKSTDKKGMTDMSST